MKRSFFGYNTKEADKAIATLNEHNDLLNTRLDRQDEEIKELRARYAGFSTVEAKLDAAVHAISSNLAVLEDAADEASFQAPTFNRDEESRVLQERLLDIAAAGTVLCDVMEALNVSPKTASLIELLPFIQKIKTDSFDALRTATALCNDQSLREAAAQIEECEQFAQSVRDEASDMRHSLTTVSSVAAYAGKLSNLGLADIERGRVATLMESEGKTEQVIRAEVSNPSEMIDNTRPPVGAPAAGEANEPDAEAADQYNGTALEASER